MGRRLWNKEDEEYLLENWGERAIRTLAKELGRTDVAIIRKSERMGLSRLAYYVEEIKFGELCSAIGQVKNTSQYRDKLLKTDFPFKYKKQSVNNKKKFLMVDIRAFWKWIEKNQTQMNFSEFEKGMLGPEPQWVNQKRKNDILKKKKVIRGDWTKKEDARLIELVSKYKYTTLEIEETMKRSHSAIVKRLKILGIKARPIKSLGIEWTKEQIKELEQMILLRQSYCFMAEKIRRSEKAIRRKVGLLYGSENIDKAANNLELMKAS